MFGRRDVATSGSLTRPFPKLCPQSDAQRRVASRWACPTFLVYFKIIRVVSLPSIQSASFRVKAVCFDYIHFPTQYLILIQNFSFGVLNLVRSYMMRMDIKHIDGSDKAAFFLWLRTMTHYNFVT